MHAINIHLPFCILLFMYMTTAIKQTHYFSTRVHFIHFNKGYFLKTTDNKVYYETNKKD